MLRNKKGFSIIELLAIIFISSAIVWPLTVTLVGNITINNRLQHYRSATSIADGALYGIDKLDFLDIQAEVDASLNYYIVLDESTCTTLLDSTADQLLCDQIFATIWSNVSLTSDTFKIYIYDYNLTQTQVDSLTGGGSTIPDKIKSTIVVSSITADLDLLTAVVWIQYFDDPVFTMVLPGLIGNE